MYEAKMFLDKKQDEHFKKHGVYADVNSKIAEWMQEYTDEVVKKLTIPVVCNNEVAVCELCNGTGIDETPSGWRVICKCRLGR